MGKSLSLSARLISIDAGTRIPLASLEKLRDDLDKRCHDLALLLAGLEDACESFDIATGMLLSSDTPRDDRRYYWELLGTSASEALDAMRKLQQNADATGKDE